jgi:hypothetical protein
LQRFLADGSVLNLIRDCVFAKRIFLQGVVSDKLEKNKGFDGFRAFGDAFASCQNLSDGWPTGGNLWSNVRRSTI